MSNRVIWTPSTDINISHYLVQTAGSAGGPWTQIASITHNLSDLFVYDPTSRVFFYNHTAGLVTDWYRLAAVDSSAQQSPWSTPFQAGTPLVSPLYSGTTTELIDSVKRRGTIPTSQTTFTPDDFLALGTEEMRSNLVPAIISVREDFFTSWADYPTSMAYFQIPYRAVGSKLRRVCYVDASGYEIDVPRIQLEDQVHASYGFTVRANRVYLTNPNSQAQYPTLRMYYYIRSNKLVPVANTAQISAFDTATKTVTLDSVPDNFLAQASYDLVKANPGYDCMSIDNPGTLAGGTISFLNDLPEDLDIGDVVCLSGESCMVQLPVEFHPVLAQAVVVKCLEAQADMEGFKAASAKLAELFQTATSLITNRSEGNPEVIIPIYSPWRI